MIPHATKLGIYFFTETRPAQKWTTRSHMFFSEQQIPTMHDLRIATATDNAMHAVQDKRDGNGKR